MNNDIGQKIRQLRMSKGMTQVELARRANITRSTVCNYEHGRRTPHLKDLRKLADMFHVGLDYFGIADKDEIFDVLVRAKDVFQSDKIDAEHKEELYREFMKLYLRLKEGNEK